MSGGEIVLAGAAGWMVLATAGGFSWSFVAARFKRRRRPVDIRGHWAYPPPVPHPAVTQADIDATWLDPWPTEMPQQQVDRLFDDLIALEGLQ